MRSFQFIDDPEVPAITKVYYSKINIGFTISLYACLILIGIYMAVSDNLILGLILIIVVGYFAFGEINKLADDEPQLVLDKGGIEINRNRYSWNEIKNAKVTFKKYAKSGTNYLILEIDNEIIRFNINEHNIKLKDLTHRWNVYQERFSCN